MSRVAFIGGFGSSKPSTEEVGNALADFFDDVDTFGFSDYIDRPDRVLRAAKGITLITHSAGALAAPKAEAETVHMWNPPVPRSIGGLIVRAVLKTGNLYRVEGFGVARAFSGDSTLELLAHPTANFGQIPNISKFNAVTEAIALKERGIASDLTWTDGDLFFKPSDYDVQLADTHGILIQAFAGQHDECMVHPAKFVEQALPEAQRNSY